MAWIMAKPGSGFNDAPVMQARSYRNRLGFSSVADSLETSRLLNERPAPLLSAAEHFSAQHGRFLRSSGSARKVPWDDETLVIARQRLTTLITPMDAMVFTRHTSDWHFFIGSMENRIREAFGKYDGTLASQRAVTESDRAIFVNLAVALVQITLSSFGAGPLVHVIGGIIQASGASTYLTTAIPGLLQWTIQVLPNTLSNLLAVRANRKVNAWLAPYIVSSKSIADLGTALRGAVKLYIDEILAVLKEIYAPYNGAHGAERVLWTIHETLSAQKGHAVVGHELEVEFLKLVTVERQRIARILDDLKCPRGLRHVTQGESLAVAYERTLWAMHILSMPKKPGNDEAFDGKLGDLIVKRLAELGILVRREESIIPLWDSLTGGRMGERIRSKDDALRAKTPGLRSSAAIVGRHRIGHRGQAALVQWAKHYVEQGPLHSCLLDHRLLELYRCYNAAPLCVHTHAGQSSHGGLLGITDFGDAFDPTQRNGEAMVLQYENTLPR